MFCCSSKCTLMCVIFLALLLSVIYLTYWDWEFIKSVIQPQPKEQVTAIYNETEPITYYMGYSDSKGFGVAWSGKDVYKDYSHYYPVVTFTKYADTLDDFIEKYPYFTIETSGYAYSDETLGNVGAGKFGTKRYLTQDFKHTNYFDRYLVNVDGNTFWWTGAMRIGFGFKYDGNILYLRPFIDGWLYSGGHVWRYLHYALNAPSITFHPEKRHSTNMA